METLTRLLAILAFSGWVGSVSAVPITGADIVTVDGTDWAQADLFTNLSWNDMNAICPLGTCGVGSLNGYDMSGWTWASALEVVDLFNIYLFPDSTNVGANILHFQPPGARQFFDDGWRSTNSQPNPFPQNPSNIYRNVYGFSSSISPNPGTVWMGIVNDPYDWDSTAGFEVLGALPTSQAEYYGGWFYRSANVPTPSTLALFGLGLACLGIGRRKRKLHG